MFGWIADAAAKAVEVTAEAVMLPEKIINKVDRAIDDAFDEFVNDSKREDD